MNLFRLISHVLIIIIPTISAEIDVEISEEECGVRVETCTLGPYRSITGACNNLQNPNWGTIYSIYDRLGSPKYGQDDSIADSVTGNPLPNARLLSQKIYTDNTHEDKFVTLNCMQYGQFVTHDLSFNLLEGSAARCCKDRQLIDDPGCASVAVPEDDPYYQNSGIGCMSVLKTQTNRDLNCSLESEYTEQISATNAYLDLSVIYGATDKLSASLRTHKNGMLILEKRGGNYWLPQSTTGEECPLNNNNSRCYRTGDVRVDQNPQLTILHIIWAREHNRLCKILKKLNRHWDDEILFQEARRIAIAQHQFITYYELLPLYLSQKVMLKNNLIFMTEGYVNDYDPLLRPHVFNEFSQAAFRHFHMMISGHLDLVDEDRCPYRTINIRDTLGKPGFLEDYDNFDALSRGLNSQPAVASDHFLVPEMSRFLFLRSSYLGLDLKSIDIQRARIHGLPSYNDVRKICGFCEAKKFEEFSDLIDEDNLKYLQENYEHPDDVDLLVGGDLERKVPGALAGPTFLCIMVRQFQKTRRSDRFWFENTKSGFTLEQLNEIRKTSISRLFCDNGNDIEMMPVEGFLQELPGNPRVPCSSIRGPDYEPWRVFKLN